jgi:hypothetical protein
MQVMPYNLRKLLVIMININRRNVHIRNLTDGNVYMCGGCIET